MPRIIEGNLIWQVGAFKDFGNWEMTTLDSFS